MAKFTQVKNYQSTLAYELAFSIFTKSLQYLPDYCVHALDVFKSKITPFFKTLSNETLQLPSSLPDPPSKPDKNNNKSDSSPPL